MQNNVLLPCGLTTGSGPTYNSAGRPVTCQRYLCDAEPTGVLLMLGSEAVGRDEWMSGAFCDKHGKNQIKPAAEIDAVYARDPFPTLWEQLQMGLSDKSWVFRPFNETEQAEIDQIMRGELVETYMTPGEFVWAPPNQPYTS
ncbi:hypothetical protein ACIGXM_14620 [Kitasatospora sp. NPDC052896]|uniref:hypothetical protein n=1 Tax=Kitasatospora sp. NPDC052896 TaxID=3364061 RepID=UPI0037C7E432